MLTYAIGDVHGHYDRFRRAIDWVIQDANTNNFTCVFLGDYIDRGPASRACLSLVMELTTDPKWVALMGNHELMMLNGLYYRMQNYEETWLNNGGISTLKDYYLDPLDPESGLDRVALDNALGFIHGLPIWYEDEHRLFVHAGLPKINGVLITPENYEQLGVKDETFLWQRSNRDCDEYHKLVVHGHTVSFLNPAVIMNRVNIDTGCGHEGGKLTVAKFETSAPKKPTFKQF